jgi:AcrR family transcriptional regulator
MSQASGRQAQKARTRAAIVAAARALETPNVEQAADRAGVSRATAYRYFPTQEALEVEIAGEAFWVEVEDVLARRDPLPVEQRLGALIDAIVTAVARDERHVRAALSVYHDTWLRDPDGPVRQDRRMRWIDATLDAASPKVRERIRLALALVVGPDPVLMLKDVAGLDDTEANGVLKWAAAALLRAAISEADA